MTTTEPDPGLEAAAGALYAQMRGVAIGQALDESERTILRRVLPEDFEDLDHGRQQHHRALARAAVDAWRLHADLNGPRA